jgi:hypothetical protein
MKRAEQPEYRLRFRALPDRVPPIIRLRRLLKLALRAFGMRCVMIEGIDIPESDTGLAQPDAAEK